MKNNKKYLKAKAVIASDLYKEKQITQSECFRHEIDLMIGKDSGVIKFKK